MRKFAGFEKALSVRQIQALDRKAIERCGVPSLALMENAGKAVASEALRLMKTIARPRVVVVCGLGNNAGDGFVAARHLLNAGVALHVFVVGSVSQLKNDAAVYSRVLKNCGCRLAEIRSVTAGFKRELQNADLVIDAIFGVGLNRDITGLFAEVIPVLNESRKKILAVDIPSGLDGTTGAVYGACVKAYQTVTFSVMKKGFLNKAAARWTGRVIVADIGIPKKLWMTM
ncbi:MAG: NAD(P)H-hydrate epimerase [Candidatus Omnitrophota bacterium]|jgi:NAD(P)H-hydrate epimerase